MPLQSIGLVPLDCILFSSWADVVISLKGWQICLWNLGHHQLSALHL